MRLVKNRLYGMRMMRERWQNATSGGVMLRQSRHCRPHSQNRVNIMHYADTVGMKINFVYVWESANTAMRIRTVM